MDVLKAGHHGSSTSSGYRFIYETDPEYAIVSCGKDNDYGHPHVETIAWKTDQTYYVAEFQSNGFDTKVWLDTKGNWVMKQTDWQTMDQVPMSVYHTFTFGSYATDQVDDVTYVEFPRSPAQIVILISPLQHLCRWDMKGLAK